MMTMPMVGQLQPCQHHRPAAARLMSLPALPRLATATSSCSNSSSRQRRRCRIHASVWGVPEPFAAPQLQQPSFSSIADMQRQVDREMDAFMSPFSSMRQMEARMDEQFREFDRQFDRAFADIDQAQRQLDAELARSMRQLQQQEPAVRIERREERAPGSYRYYESIQIRSGGTSSMTVLTPAHSTALFSPLLFAALVLAGAYAAVTAAFNPHIHLANGSAQERLVTRPKTLSLGAP
ncbi:hypothetical protein OEZ85_008969 [Tetradesmus obliquus]|uniref:Uncharacterized protein n=1 Tax=Tetradesmus obliquus TaxID=3088 RepID=A0ABY8TKE4_TETOB|nr:hypothetical protein OEZ85_008969 [Tetradesmus obliquus]